MACLFVSDAIAILGSAYSSALASVPDLSLVSIRLPPKVNRRIGSAHGGRHHRDTNPPHMQVYVWGKR